MKKLWILFASAAMLLACNDFDWLASRVDNLEQRVEALEETVEKMNTNVSSLQTIVNSLKDCNFIKEVTAVEGGYKITFSDGEEITIYNGAKGDDGAPGADGKTPVISVKMDTDGVYYWTVDGEWLLDSEGNKIRTSGETPVVGVKQDTDGVYYWTVNGEWILGADGEKLVANNPSADTFTEINTDNPDYVLFVLSDGTTIKIPTWTAYEALQLHCNEANTTIEALEAVVLAIADKDYVTKVEPATANGLICGYTIYFSKRNPVIFYNCVDATTPEVGVALDADAYYWTLDGALVDPKLAVTEDGAAPKLKVEEGKWHISYDGAQTWTALNSFSEEGDSKGIVVSQDENAVYFTLPDGTVLALGKDAEYEDNAGVVNRQFADIVAFATANKQVYYNIAVNGEEHCPYYLNVDPNLYGEVLYPEQKFIDYAATRSITPVYSDLQKEGMLSISVSGDVHVLYATPVEKVTEVDPTYGWTSESNKIKNVDDLVAIELSVPAQDKIGLGTSAVLLGEPVVNGNAASLTLASSGSCIYGIGHVNKNDLSGTLEEYVQNVIDTDTWGNNMKLTSGLPESYELKDLGYSTVYYVYTYSYGADGKVGALQYKEFVTADIVFNSEYTISAEQTSDLSFKSAKFNVTYSSPVAGYAYQVFTKEAFQTSYGGDAVSAAKADMTANAMSTGAELSLFSELELGVEQVLVLLPVGEDGSFGQPVSYDILLKEYAITSSATVSLKVNNSSYDSNYNTIGKVTFEHSDNCVGYYYAIIQYSDWNLNKDGDLGLFVVSGYELTYMDNFNEFSYTQDGYRDKPYIVVFPVDSEGKLGQVASAKIY